MRIRGDFKQYLSRVSSSKILNVLKLSPRVFVLPRVAVFPSNLCNFDCLMCSCARHHARNVERMNPCLMGKVVDDCSKLPFKPLLHFSGCGEPLIYPGIRDAMRLCNTRKLSWGMTTNGYLLEEHAVDLVSNDCLALNVSIHGRAQENDKITGVDGSFDKVVGGLKQLAKTKELLRKRTPFVAIDCVITNDNVLTLKNILSTFMRLPVNSITFQHPIFSSDDLPICDKNRLHELAKFIVFLEDTRFPVNVFAHPKIKAKDIVGYYTEKDYKFNESCIFPWLAISVHPDGNVELCPFSARDQFIGNLRTDSLRSIVNSRKATELRKHVRKRTLKLLPKPPECFRCCFRQYY